MVDNIIKHLMPLVFVVAVSSLFGGTLYYVVGDAKITYWEGWAVFGSMMLIIYVSLVFTIWWEGRYTKKDKGELI